MSAPFATTPPTCGLGPSDKGSATVLIGGMPAARVGDQITEAGAPNPIAMGEPTVLIGG